MLTRLLRVQTLAPHWTNNPNFGKVTIAMGFSTTLPNRSVVYGEEACSFVCCCCSTISAGVLAAKLTQRRTRVTWSRVCKQLLLLQVYATCGPTWTRKSSQSYQKTCCSLSTLTLLTSASNPSTFRHCWKLPMHCSSNPHPTTVFVTRTSEATLRDLR